MHKQNSKLYLIFIVAFLAMHLTGLLVINLPYIINATIVFAAVFVVIMLSGKWFLGKKIKETIRDVGFLKADLQKIIPGIIISAALLCTYPLLGFLLDTKIGMAKNWQLNMIGLLLTAGFAEEMLFRGFLFAGLRRQMSFKKAVIVSAIVFTTVHLLLFTYFSWPIALLSTMLAAGLSLPFAYLFEQGENSIWSAALVHATIRTVGMVFTTTEENLPALASVWIIISLVVPYIVLMFCKPFREMCNNNKNPV